MRASLLLLALAWLPSAARAQCAEGRVSTGEGTRTPAGAVRARLSASLTVATPPWSAARDEGNATGSSGVSRTSTKG